MMSGAKNYLFHGSAPYVGMTDPIPTTFSTDIGTSWRASLNPTRQFYQTNGEHFSSL
jgi:hypothetical protein